MGFDSASDDSAVPVTQTNPNFWLPWCCVRFFDTQQHAERTLLKLLLLYAYSMLCKYTNLI